MANARRNDNPTQFRHGLDVEIPTIKILLYTDDPDGVTQSTAQEKPFSLGLMLERLRSHAPVSAQLDPRYVCRYKLGDPQFIAKLNTVLRQESFDEIWFFGVNQINLSGFSRSFFEGGPDNELDAAERSELERVMGALGVGVLITGDHSNARPANAALNPNPPCPDGGATANHLGLGRAIGRCVPRAGLLRKWDDQPTNLPAEWVNTVGPFGEEFDETPQDLILMNVDERGELDPQGEPHPLFFYKPGKFITCFPDHTHEGSLDFPTTFDPAVWPAALNTGDPQPLPHVVAYGINQRTSKRVGVVAAYRGDLAGVGRIVADSTWHHYFNFNLRGFPHPAPEGSAADKIGQFYANLAIWLAPPGKQRQMAHAMFWELAKYTMRLEHRTDDPDSELTCGRSADAVFRSVASPCEVHELLQAITPDRYGTLKFSERPMVLSEIPSRQLLLGSIMCSYHDEMLRANTAEEYEPLGVDEVIALGFERAFKKHVDILSQKKEHAQRFL
jgi:hypothetical protein